MMTVAVKFGANETGNVVGDLKPRLITLGAKTLWLHLPSLNQQCQVLALTHVPEHLELTRYRPIGYASLGRLFPMHDQCSFGSLV
jgi:hypothetical protein